MICVDPVELSKKVKPMELQSKRFVPPLDMAEFFPSGLWSYTSSTYGSCYFLACPSYPSYFCCDVVKFVLFGWFCPRCFINLNNAASETIDDCAHALFDLFVQQAKQNLAQHFGTHDNNKPIPSCPHALLREFDPSTHKLTSVCFNSLIVSSFLISILWSLNS